jgi:hypothetical protein
MARRDLKGASCQARCSPVVHAAGFHHVSQGTRIVDRLVLGDCGHLRSVGPTHRSFLGRGSLARPASAGWVARRASSRSSAGFQAGSSTTSAKGSVARLTMRRAVASRLAVNVAARSMTSSMCAGLLRACGVRMYRWAMREAPGAQAAASRGLLRPAGAELVPPTAGGTAWVQRRGRLRS